MATAVDPAAILTSVASTVTVGRYFTLSAWIMLIYDWLIHLDKEVDLFWLKPWSVAKVLYLSNRYLPIIFLGVHSMVFLNPQVTDRVCLFWFKFEGYTGVTEVAVVELILGFRVLALWNRHKLVIAIVGMAMLAEVGTMLGILTSTYINMGATATVIPGVAYRACIPFNIPGYFFAFWLPPLGYESIVFLLAAAKGYSTIRHGFTSWTFRNTGSRLLQVMIRDSLFYFLVIFGCDLACSLVWLRGPDSLLQAVVGFGLAIPSIAGSHMLLNLRDAYYHPTGETTIGRSDYSRTGAGELPTFKTYGGSGGGKSHPKDELDTSWMDSTRDYKTVDHPDLKAIAGSTSTFSQTRTIQFHGDNDTTTSSHGGGGGKGSVDMRHTSTVLGVRAARRVPTPTGQQPPMPTHPISSQSPLSETTIHAVVRRVSLEGEVIPSKFDDSSQGHEGQDAYELRNMATS